MARCILLSSLVVFGSCAQSSFEAFVPDGTLTARGYASIPQLDNFIEQRMAAAHVPGIQVAIVKDAEVVWANAYGLANADTGEPMTLDNPISLASISKLITVTSVMQAVEDGWLTLDGDVQSWTAFSVENPTHSDVIELEDLLTHTSSIRDNWSVLDANYIAGDPTISLGDYMESYLDPAGSNYSASSNWYSQAPGANYRYSNIGMSLAGHLVEASSGIAFDDWSDDRVFEPLQMDNTGWHLEDLDESMVARPHFPAGGGGFSVLPNYGYPDYPGGQLRSTVEDMGRFMAMFVSGGSLDGEVILDPATVQDMQQVRVPSAGQALGWYTTQKWGDTYMGHDGSDPGLSSEMMFRVSDGTGFLVFMNGEAFPWSKVADIERVLMYVADNHL